MRAVETTALVSFAAGHKASDRDTHFVLPITLGKCRWNSKGQQECTEQAKSLSLDSKWRWTHKASEPTNCYTDSEWDASICPDDETCATNCAVGAVTEENWAETYGAAQNGNGADVGFVTQGPYSVNVGAVGRFHLP